MVFKGKFRILAFCKRKVAPLVRNNRNKSSGGRKSTGSI